MLQLRLTRSLIETLFIHAISRVSIDLVKQHGVMIGLVDAIWTVSVLLEICLYST